MYMCIVYPLCNTLYNLQIHSPKLPMMIMPFSQQLSIPITERPPLGAPARPWPCPGAAPARRAQPHQRHLAPRAPRAHPRQPRHGVRLPRHQTAAQAAPAAVLVLERNW